jgi:hypothetical protein
MPHPAAVLSILRPEGSEFLFVQIVTKADYPWLPNGSEASIIPV